MSNTGSNITKKDYLIGALVGLFTGILALFIFSFLDVQFPNKELILILGIPVLWALGVWFGKFLSKWILFFAQFGKFAAVGFLNAAIDFSILNSVSFFTGITAGLLVGWVNVPGFFAATVNGYLWNKFWVFPVRSSPPQGPYGRASADATSNGVFHEFPRFFAVTIIGLLINSSIIVILTTFLAPIGASEQSWLNISKIAANATALIWNFVGYKSIAFKKHV